MKSVTIIFEVFVGSLLAFAVYKVVEVIIQMKKKNK